MSLPMIAKMLGLPEEIAEQLPALAAQVPKLLQDAGALVTGIDDRVRNIETTLASIETKVDLLGRALIEFLEKQNHVSEPDAATGNSSNHTAAGNGATA